MSLTKSVLDGLKHTKTSNTLDAGYKNLEKAKIMTMQNTKKILEIDHSYKM